MFHAPALRSRPPFSHAGIVLPALFALGLASCAGSSPETGSGNTVGTTRDVRLTSHENSVLSIGRDPVLEFPHDARGPGSPGTLTDLGEGRARLLFRAEDLQATHLEFLPGLPVGVEIIPADMIGTIDFCTGEVSYAFDGLFQPYVFDFRPEPLSVVTEQTTGTSSGLFREVTGRPLDAKGDLRMVSVAVVPATGDPAVDEPLGLPTDAVSELEVHLDFPQGRFPCPGDPPPAVAEQVHMAVGKEGLLSIAFLGSFATFPYDGAGSNGVGKLGTGSAGRVPVTFERFEVPALPFLPGSDLIRIEITPHQLAGGIDFCTGEVELDFDATFTPCMGEQEMTSLSVVTTITSETSTGFTQSVTGRRLDRWGDATLAGVARVPATGDPLIDRMLGLPNDAVCQLPVHMDFPGGMRPPCP